jgi:Acetyltransferase (GNAT) family
MTFPCFTPFLVSSDPAKLTYSLIVNGQPAGLALGALRPGGDADLLSLYVAPNFRGRGLAGRLLSGFEAEVYARAAQRLVGTYTYDPEAADHIGTLLKTQGWLLSSPRMLVCRANRRLLEAPWMQRPMETTYEITPWSTVTPAERTLLEERKSSIPETLYPFPWEREFYPLEPGNSLALRENGCLRGWILTHRINAQTVRYTCAYVDDSRQRLALGIDLIAEAARRQVQLFGTETRGIWATPYKYSRMISFIRRRMAPYLESIRESVQASKPLVRGIAAEA